MHVMAGVVGISFLATVLSMNELPKPTTTGLKNPESAAVNRDGKVFLSEIGEFGKDGDGRIAVIDESGSPSTFVGNLNDPKGMAFWNEFLFVTDVNRVLSVDGVGNAKVLAAKEAFPSPPVFLNDVAVDPDGNVYVSDSGADTGKGGAIYRIDRKGKVTEVASARTIPSLKRPNGLALDGVSFVLVVDFLDGGLYRVKIADGTAEKIADGFEGGDGLVWDMYGRLFISSWTQGKVWGIEKPGDKPILMVSGFQSAADFCLDHKGEALLVPDMKAGTLSKLATKIPGRELDLSPMPVKPVPAFAKLKWTGWERVDDAGKVVPLRPIFLTHAGDGSNRNFVTVQQGTIHVFPNSDDATDTKIFLDISDRTFYSDNENEQGLLGLAFHPKFKENGEFFVYYSLKSKRFTNVISRFRVSKSDPDKADPNSEEELMRFTRPFWNHDGGTICFGPDGFLYVAIGDGGAANDPFRNGQNMKSHLGKILRVDVDNPGNGKKYGIPKDNPFVDRPETAPEIWAYGVRNPWRIAFDRTTGQLWAADVGQNIFEEIDIITKGGNYGWNLREGFHPFGKEGVGVQNELIDPIWEYHHDIGRSITGGSVYRGKKLPQLAGHYLYGDYTSSRIWALKYDESSKRVVANRPITTINQPIVSFGEDEQGEVYFMVTTVSGEGIFRFAPTENK